MGDRSKAYLRRTKTGVLPDAPEPTKPVRTDRQNGPIVDYDMIPRREYEEKLKRGRKNSYANRSDAWTEEEEKTVIRMTRGGYDADEIAKRITGRTATAVEAKILRMKKKGEI